MRVKLNGVIWDKERVQALLDKSDQAVARALMRIYANQTADERNAGTTKHHNGVGFTGRDAEFLSDIARKWQIYGRWASARQANAVRKAIKKYHRQLLQEIAEKPGAEVIKGRLKPEDMQPDLMLEAAHQTEQAEPAGFGEY